MTVILNHCIFDMIYYIYSYFFAFRIYFYLAVKLHKMAKFDNYSRKLACINFYSNFVKYDILNNSQISTTNIK